MAPPRLLMFFGVMGTVCTVASALRAKRTNDFEARVTSYTLNKFIEDFGRTYEMGSEEYLHRYSVFEASIAQIVATNAREGQLWTAGVHPFMDLTDEERERLHGYKPSSPRKPSIIALELETNETVYRGSGDSFHIAMPPVLNQGSLCGSCWAIAATQAVEVQLMKTDNPTREKLYGSPMRLSTQAVLECAQIENPHNCGGPGGCKGATSEVAFDYIRDHGIPLSSEHYYHPTQVSKQCPLEPYPANWARVTIDGWRALPRNKAQPLMQAIVEDGAVVVAIDSHNLYPYSSGIFNDCPKDAIVSHALLATGYGDDVGQKYWSLQNSWGPRWGEAGSVRVFRHDNEDQWCGTDNHPEEGFACDGETKPVTVCGTCGILFDMLIPSGPEVQAPQQAGSDVSSSVSQPDSDPQSPAPGAHAGNPNHEFTSWGMPPATPVDLVSADAQVDSYLSTPAPDPSTNSNQALTTTPPEMSTSLPQASKEVADQQQVEPFNTFMPAPQTVLDPSIAPTESDSLTIVEPTIQAVVGQSNTKSLLPSDVAPESQSVVPPYVPDSSAVSDAPTSDVAKMQQLLKQHEIVQEDAPTPPADPPPVAVNSLTPEGERVKPDYVSPTVTASVDATEPVVKAPVVSSDSSIENVWQHLAEAEPAAKASSTTQVVQDENGPPVVQDETAQAWMNGPVVDQQDSNVNMPTPATFAKSVDEYNAKSNSYDRSVTNVGDVMPVPVAEVPPLVVSHSDSQPKDDDSFDVQSLSTADGDSGSKVTVLDSNNNVAASSPPDSSVTDGMKRLFSNYNFG